MGERPVRRSFRLLLRRRLRSARRRRSPPAWIRAWPWRTMSKRAGSRRSRFKLYRERLGGGERGDMFSSKKKTSEEEEALQKKNCESESEEPSKRKENSAPCRPLSPSLSQPFRSIASPSLARAESHDAPLAPWKSRNRIGPSDKLKESLQSINREAPINQHYMFESYLADLLVPYLGHFLDISPESLRVSLFSGE